MDSRRVLSAGIFILAVLALLLLYRGEQAPPQGVRPIGTRVIIRGPLGLPSVPIPADNPPTLETIALGRRLYYDPVLSADKTVSCATCHDPAFGFADAKPVSVGVQRKTGTRNSPTIINAAYYSAQYWDGRAPSLEKQAEGPVQDPEEMAHTLKGVEERLMADPSYRVQFEKAFGPGPITYEMVEKAIASFERTVLAGNSPFDRWYYHGDTQALSPAAQRGFEVFRDARKGNCVSCHTIGENYALFMDNKFHNLGVAVKDDKVVDNGRHNVTQNEADRGAFKTPSLRNVALSAPYFHDGSRQTLKEAVDFFIGGGNPNPRLDKQIHALAFLTGQERADLVAFLESLTGKVPPETRAPSPPPPAKN